jgi:Na+-transporting NADH:ubiquinone oxidoreductase subunit C
MREDTRTILFAAAVCLVVSLLLSGTAAALKPAQEANEAFDVKRNIVKAFGVDIAGMERTEIEATYEKHIAEVEGALPLYVWTEEGAEDPSKYAFPISGKGLWGDIFAYISLETDLRTIAGISFYKHVETPGLGAEVEKDWFQKQFVEKKLYDDNRAPLDFRVVKPGSGSLDDHSVDGISGATLTGEGVENFLRSDAATYAEYLKTVMEND